MIMSKLLAHSMKTEYIHVAVDEKKNRPVDIIPPGRHIFLQDIRVHRKKKGQKRHLQKGLGVLSFGYRF